MSRAVGSEINQCVFDGLMISDAYLSRSSETSRARMGMNCKFAGFMQAMVSHLDCLDWSDISERDQLDKRTKKAYKRFSARSRVDSYLTTQYNRWYPQGSKIVPRDIKLSDEMLLWWYLGDGTLHRRKSRPNYRRIMFCTDSFSVEDNEFLISKLKDRFGNKSIYLEKNEIAVASDALVGLCKVLNGKNPVAEYEYKFDFGQYVDKDYKKKSYADRPLAHINEYRKKHKVRELTFESKEEINHV